MLLGKYVNKYYLKYWYFYLLGVIALVAVDYVQLFQPEVLGQIIDHLSDSTKNGTPADTGLIARLCGKIMAVAAVMFAGRMLWRYTLFNASQRIEAGLRREMFEKSERLSQRYYHETKVGSIMSWFTTDLETVEEFTGFGTVQLVDALFLGILVIIRMVKMDWVLALFATVPMILIIVWGVLVEKYMGLKWEERQREYDRLYDFTQENFSGIRVIKAFVKETAELHAFAKVARKNRDSNISFVRVSVFFDVVIEIIIAVIMAVIVGFGSWFVWAAVSGSPVVIFRHPVVLTAGQLVTFFGYFESLIWPMIALGSLVTMLSRARASMKRVTAFLEAGEDLTDRENAEVLSGVRGGIEFRGLTFAYPGASEPALKDISFRIEPGETVGVVGRVGSGKTTILALLTRLYNVDDGTLFIDGRDVMDCTVASVREAVAAVPQDNFLFSDTVEHNITFSKEGATHEAAAAAAAFADVADNIDSFPDGYGTLTGERGVTLSGGQKQRISIARAYLKDAPIMVMDDSVSAVDVGTEEKILANIRKLRAGKTTVIIASRVSTVAHADRIIVLNEGRLEAFGSPSELAGSSPTYKKMVMLQELEKEVSGADRESGVRADG